jgi:tetratricopeptide (TPR) repeat protein
VIDVMVRRAPKLKRLNPDERYLKGENPLPWQLPQDQLDRLEVVERNLGAVIDRGRGEWPALYRAARTIRGYLRAFLLRHGEACDDLSAVVAQGDVDPNVLVNLAVFRIINDQAADALAAAEQAVRQGDAVQAWLVLADAAGFAGNWDRSQAAAQEALRRATGHDRERAYSAITEALRRLKRVDEAASVLETGLAKTPGSDELLSMRALVLLDRGEVDQALAVSRDAIAQASGGRRYLATLRAADLAFQARRYADAVPLDVRVESRWETADHRLNLGALNQPIQDQVIVPTDTLHAYVGRIGFLVPHGTDAELSVRVTYNAPLGGDGELLLAFQYRSRQGWGNGPTRYRFRLASGMRYGSLRPA